jgi:hypothetical protein
MGAQSNWRESGDLAMMFQGAYSTAFYRALAKALHLEVREPGKTEDIRRAWSQFHELRESHPFPVPQSQAARCGLLVPLPS